MHDSLAGIVQSRFEGPGFASALKTSQLGSSNNQRYQHRATDQLNPCGPNARQGSGLQFSWRPLYDSDNIYDQNQHSRVHADGS